MRLMMHPDAEVQKQTLTLVYPTLNPHVALRQTCAARSWPCG